MTTFNSLYRPIDLLYDTSINGSLIQFNTDTKCVEANNAKRVNITRITLNGKQCKINDDENRLTKHVGLGVP